MVVGDDDQAVFKFQGAEVSNILDFERMYREPQLIVLKENYRSTQPILDLARRVIAQGTNRLERMIPTLKKELVAARKDLSPGTIQGREFCRAMPEYQWTAREVKSLLEKEKIPCEGIAIIAGSTKT